MRNKQVKQSISHPELDSGSSTLAASLNNNMRGRFQIKFGMTLCNNSGFTRPSLFPSPRRTGKVGNLGAALYPRQKPSRMTNIASGFNHPSLVTPQGFYAGYSEGKRGFTLIELLVVVLIIGILASVALPQYNKAVEKSRAAEAWSILKAVDDAQKVKNMEEGTVDVFYPLEELSVAFINENGTPATGSYFDPGGHFTYLNSASQHWEGNYFVAIHNVRYDPEYILFLEDGKRKCNAALSSGDEKCKYLVGQTVYTTNCVSSGNCYTE